MVFKHMLMFSQKHKHVLAKTFKCFQKMSKCFFVLVRRASEAHHLLPFVAGANSIFPSSIFIISIKKTPGHQPLLISKNSVKQ